MKKAIEIIPLKGVKMDNLDIDLGNDIAESTNKCKITKGV